MKPRAVLNRGHGDCMMDIRVTARQGRAADVVGTLLMITNCHAQLLEVIDARQSTYLSALLIEHYSSW